MLRDVGLKEKELARTNKENLEQGIPLVVLLAEMRDFLDKNQNQEL